MTTDDRERLLGQIMLGVKPRTACDDLAIPYGDLLDELARDHAFHLSFFSACASRYHVEHMPTPEE
jgi:hypothetical protein